MPDGYSKRHMSSSQTLTSNAAASEAWLREMQESMLLVNSILSIVHPALHSAALRCRETLLQDPQYSRLHRWVRQWSCLFTGTSVIRNRGCPPHRDVGTKASWYDLLFSLGQHEECALRLRDIGLDLAYGPGTAIALCGKVLRHEVSHFVGVRTCHAWFMRQAVVEGLTNDSPSWMDWNTYRRYCHSGFLASMIF